MYSRFLYIYIRTYVLPWGLIWPKIQDILFLNYSIFLTTGLENVCSTIYSDIIYCCVTYKFNKYDSKIISVTVGTLLGDGHVELRSRRGHYTLKQSANNKEWLYWLH